MDDSDQSKQFSPSGAQTHTPSDPRAPASSLCRGVVFISHEKTDGGLAREIRAHLEAGGFTCWMAPDDITGPVPWPEQINRAIAACDVMLVIVSANANSSMHVSREVDIAVETGKPVLPVRVADIAPTGGLDYLLRLAQWIDLFPGSIADHASSLRHMVASMLSERGLAPLPTEPPPSSPPKPPGRHWSPRRSVVVVGAVAVVAIVVMVVALALQGDDEPSAPSEARPSAQIDGDSSAQEESGPSTEGDGSAGTAAEVDFEDQFDGAFGDGWSWLYEDPELWSLTATPGWLQITAVEAAQNVLVRDAPQDPYEITTALRFRPTSNFQFAGLIVGPDLTNYLQLGRAHCDVPDVCIGDGVYLDNVENNEMLPSSTVEIATDTDVVYLRLVVNGDSYAGFVSEDGTTWTLVGERTRSFDNPELGLIAYQAAQKPAVAEFDYITVTSPSDGATPAAASGTNAAGPAPAGATEADLVAFLASFVRQVEEIAFLPDEEFTAAAQEAVAWADASWPLVRGVPYEIRSNEAANALVEAIDTIIEGLRVVSTGDMTGGPTVADGIEKWNDYVVTFES